MTGVLLMICLLAWMGCFCSSLRLRQILIECPLLPGQHAHTLGSGWDQCS